MKRYSFSHGTVVMFANGSAAAYAKHGAIIGPICANLEAAVRLLWTTRVDPYVAASDVWLDGIGS